MKTIVTGEVKLGVGTMYREWFTSRGRRKGRHKQWQAITRHAVRFGYLPHVVLLVALRHGKAYEERRIFREGLSSGALVVLVVAL